VCRVLGKLRWPTGWYAAVRKAGELAVRRNRWRCGQCRYEVSVTAGTLFQDKSPAPDNLVRAMWYVEPEERRQRVLSVCWAWQLQSIGVGGVKVNTSLTFEIERSIVTSSNRVRISQRHACEALDGSSCGSIRSGNPCCHPTRMTP